MMQFKYPELLYFLLLLLIPIFIHLFQLRKFKKVAFTNVEFLKKVELQTRKSAKLKKFLILLTRLLFIASIVLAFAQPYFSSYKKNQKFQTIVYLDNSLSMQAKTGNNSLLEKAKQQLIQYLNLKGSNFSLLTNDNFYNNLDKKQLKNELLSVTYYPITKKMDAVFQKAKYQFDKDNNTKKNLIVISDFKDASIKKLDTNIHYTFVQLMADHQPNIGIDSLSISKQTPDKITLKVAVSSNQKKQNTTSFSLYDNNRLLGKSAVDFKENTKKNTLFSIPKTQNLNGRIITTDNQKTFDNSLFFSIQKPKKIKVLAIGKNNKFLSKIYTKDQFDFKDTRHTQIDFNLFKKQNTIILNELDSIDTALQKVLLSFIKNGGSVIIIPSENIQKENYNTFLKNLKIGKIIQKHQQELKINKIVFKHPILKGVFEKEVINFQYPKVKTFYKTIFNSSNGILKLENQQDFVTQISAQKGKIYWFSSPINTKQSNFKNSPLIVPLFYNIATHSYQISKLYYLIGKKNTIDIPVKLNSDEVVKIKEKNHSENSFIPLQEIYNEKVRVFLDNFPLKAGFYSVKNNDKNLQNLAFNYSREESNPPDIDLSYLKKYPNLKISDNLVATLEQLSIEKQQKNYWKYFVFLALLFLISEMLILKFWKK